LKDKNKVSVVATATALHTVTMVYWKETAFPFWRAMDRCWNRNAVSLLSSVTVVIRLPIALWPCHAMYWVSQWHDMAVLLLLLLVFSEFCGCKLFDTVGWAQ